MLESQRIQIKEMKPNSIGREKPSGEPLSPLLRGHGAHSSLLCGLLYSPALFSDQLLLLVALHMTQNGSHSRYALSAWLSTANGDFCVSKTEFLRKKILVGHPWVRCLAPDQSAKRIGGRINEVIPTSEETVLGRIFEKYVKESQAPKMYLM